MRRRKYIKLFGIGLPILGLTLPTLTMSGCGQSTKAFYEGSKLFSYSEWQLLSRLVDIIIPTTDSPSATQVGVPERIEKLLTNNYSADMRSVLLKGLEFFINQCVSQFGKPFDECDDAQLSDILNLIIANTSTGTVLDSHPFYPLLKGLTVSAFFTSKTMVLYFREKEELMRNDAEEIQ